MGQQDLHVCGRNGGQVLGWAGLLRGVVKSPGLSGSVGNLYTSW